MLNIIMDIEEFAAQSRLASREAAGVIWSLISMMSYADVVIMLLKPHKLILWKQSTKYYYNAL